MRIFTAVLLCAAMAVSSAAESRRPAPIYHKPLQRDGAHHHDPGHGHDHGHSQGDSAYFDSGIAGGQASYSQGGASDYSAGGGYTQAPAYSAPAPAAAPAAGYSAGGSYSGEAQASSYNAAPSGGDYGNSQNQGYYYYYYPVQDSKGGKLKNKAKGAWDSMWGSVTSLAGKIPKLPSTYKDDEDAIYGLAVAALVLLIIAAVLLVTAPFISLGIPALSTGTTFSLGSIFNTTGTGLTIDLSFLGIPLQLYNPFFGRESAGNTWGSWFTPENVDKVSSYVLEKIEEYRKKVE